MAKADIKIKGRTYSVACAPGQEARLEALGVELNRQVEGIANAVGDIGEARLLLVAALSLLDELTVAKKAGPPPSDLESKMAKALSDASGRITEMADRLEERD